MNDDQYQPISCSAYDVYEIAIMRRQCLQLSWWEGQHEKCSERVQPVDLKVRDGAEYLVFRRGSAHGETRQVRLDRIISASLEKS